MSKITNDGLTQSGTILYSCTHMATVGVKEQAFQCTPISLVTEFIARVNVYV